MTSLSNPGSRRRTRLVWLVAVAVTTVLSVVFWPRAPNRAGRTSPDAGRDHAGTSSSMAPLAPPPGSVPTYLEPPTTPPDPGNPPPGFDPRRGEYPVKLDALRARMPDNLYWRVAAPTNDPELLAARAARERDLEARRGRITAGEASEQEIRDYFDERRRESQDFVALAREALTRYGDELTDRDRGLFGLGAKLHEEKLAEIDRSIADALARKRVQDERRAAWRAAGSPVPAKHD